MKVNYDLEIIVWEDSILGFAGWKNIKSQHILKEKMISVGFLTHEDKNKIILYPHLHLKETNGAGDITIPKLAIRKRKKIKINDL